MSRISEYNTVVAKSLTQLEEGVRYNLERDWQPMGGICFLPSLDDPYVQVMVRYEPELISITGPSDIRDIPIAPHE